MGARAPPQSSRGQTRELRNRRLTTRRSERQGGGTIKPTPFFYVQARGLGLANDWIYVQENAERIHASPCYFLKLKDEIIWQDVINIKDMSCHIGSIIANPINFQLNYKRNPTPQASEVI